MKTLDQKFEDAFEEAHATDFMRGDISKGDAKYWARLGWDAFREMVQKEFLEDSIENSVRQLKVYAEAHPSVFAAVMERMEKA